MADRKIEKGCLFFHYKMNLQLLIIVLLAVLFGCNKAPEESKVVVPVPKPQSSLISKIFNFEMLGVNLAYLEKMTGPAMNTYDGRKKGDITNIYKIDNCEISVGISKGVVRSLGIGYLSPECTFDPNLFLTVKGFDKELPMAHEMTFGQFDADHTDGKYTATCLSNCGNASASEKFYEEWQGPHAYSYLEVRIGVEISNNDVISASNKWEDAMVKGEGEDWVMDTKFRCNHKYDHIAKEAFKNIKITSITIGYDVVHDDCKH